MERNELNLSKRVKLVPKIIGMKDWCEKCFEVKADRILTNEEWGKIHSYHQENS